MFQPPNWGGFPYTTPVVWCLFPEDTYRWNRFIELSRSKFDPCTYSPSIWLCVSPWFRRVNHSTLYTTRKFGVYQQLYINCGFHGSPKTIFSWEKENRNPEILPLILLFERASSPFRSQPLFQRCEQSLKDARVPPEKSISKVSQEALTLFFFEPNGMKCFCSAHFFKELGLSLKNWAAMSHLGYMGSVSNNGVVTLAPLFKRMALKGHIGQRPSAKWMELQGTPWPWDSTEAKGGHGAPRGRQQSEKDGSWNVRIMQWKRHLLQQQQWLKPSWISLKIPIKDTCRSNISLKQVDCSG